MFGQIEIEIEAFQPIAFPHFDEFINHHLWEDHAPLRMIGMRQRQKPFWEKTLFPDLLRRHGPQ